MDSDLRNALIAEGEALRGCLSRESLTSEERSALGKRYEDIREILQKNVVTTPSPGVERSNYRKPTIHRDPQRFRERYPSLKLVIVFYKILAVFLLLVALVLAVISVANETYLLLPSVLGVLVGAVFSFATAELIRLAMDIESSVRRTADSVQSWER